MAKLVFLAADSLIMRRLGVVAFDALQFQRFHRARLPLDFLFQTLQQLALLDDDAVQLLDLMFEVCEVRFNFFSAPGIFVCHETILPAPPPEVETVNDLALRRKPICGTLGAEIKCRAKLQSQSPPPT